MEVRNAAPDLDLQDVASLKLSALIFATILAIGSGAATDLNNIENIRPSGTNPINITGNLDLQGNNIDSIGSLTNYYGSACNTGNVMIHVNNDGTFDCVDATGEVQGDFVSRSGDTMLGNLDMNGYALTDTTGTLTLGGGAVGVSSGNLVLNNNALTQVDWANSDNPNTDTQDLSISGDTISLTNGGSVTINDNTGTDSQTLSTTADTTGTNDNITISNGNTITVDDDYAANTDASTKCGFDQVLEGGNTCVTNYEAGDDGDSSSSNEIQGISSVVGQDSVLGSGETIDASSGTFRLPVGTDAY